MLSGGLLLCGCSLLSSLLLLLLCSLLLLCLSMLLLALGVGADAPVLVPEVVLEVERVVVGLVGVVGSVVLAVDVTEVAAVVALRLGDLRVDWSSRWSWLGSSRWSPSGSATSGVFC